LYNFYFIITYKKRFFLIYICALKMNAEAAEHEITVPPGALKMLRNHMMHVWYELTDDPKDPLINKPEQTFMPGSRGTHVGTVDALTEERREGKVKNAIAFSHITGNRNEFENIECLYHDIPSGLGMMVDGMVIDKKSIEETKGFDTHYDMNEAGNILAIFIVPLGWVEAYHNKQVCHRCGKFPSYNKCLACNGGSFCTDECLLRAKMGGVHSDVVCDEFVNQLVDVANPVLVETSKDKKEKET
jgi:hypothetical protein